MAATRAKTIGRVDISAASSLRKYAAPRASHSPKTTNQTVATVVRKLDLEQTGGRERWRNGTSQAPLSAAITELFAVVPIPHGHSRRTQNECTLTALALLATSALDLCLTANKRRAKLQPLCFEASSPHISAFPQTNHCHQIMLTQAITASRLPVHLGRGCRR